ncbi:MAG: DUF3604 domain-containing protein, partial [Chloroflexota bacterium]
GSYHVNDGNGLAAVAATGLTRDALWQALYDRRCYATTGDRIVLNFSLSLAGPAPSAEAAGARNGGGPFPMGSDLAVDLAAVGPRTLHIRLAGTATIDLVEVLRNNEVVYTARPGTDAWGGEWTDAAPLPPLALAPTFAGDRPFVFYYLRVTQANRQIAWASPIWLTQRV